MCAARGKELKRELMSSVGNSGQAVGVGGWGPLQRRRSCGRIFRHVSRPLKQEHVPAVRAPPTYKRQLQGMLHMG